MAKITYSMDELSTKLYRETAKGLTIEGTVTITSQNDRFGGLDITREYTFDRYRAKEQCHYDKEDREEFETMNMIDVMKWFSGHFLKENMVLRLNDWSNSEAKISVRKAKAGLDYCITK